MPTATMRHPTVWTVLRLRSLLLPASAPVMAAAWLCLASTAGAQESASITGVVVDSATGAPIASADLRIEELARSVGTAPGGRFAFLRVPAAEHTLVIEALGYASARVRVDARRGDTAHVVVRLAPVPLPLPTVDAEASAATRSDWLGGFWERRQRGTGFFLTRQQIEELRAHRVVDVVSRAPGTRIVRLDAVGGGHIVTFARHTTMSGLCPPMVYLDGQLLPMTEAGLDELRPDDLEAVEIYSGPARLPAQFNRTGTAARAGGGVASSPRCGVVILWTRRGGGTQ